MKKEIVILSLLGILLALPASAENALLYLAPAQSQLTTGQAINASLNFDAKNNKVCVIKGTIVFQNLICQAIGAPEGLVAMSQPTCANPSFVFGAKNCSIASVAKLASITAKAGSLGTAGIQIKDIKIVGGSNAQTDIAFNSGSASYAVVASGAAVVPTPSARPEAEEKPVIKSAESTTTAKAPDQKQEPQNTANPSPEANLASDSVVDQAVQPAALSQAGREKNIRTGVSILFLCIAGWLAYQLYLHVKPKDQA